MRESVLYFPHIEIQNKDWLKKSLLLWDNIYRIVPDSYIPADDDEMKLAVDNGLVRSIRLEPDDRRGFAAEFSAFIEQLEFMPAGLEHDETMLLHPEKVDSHLYPLLEQHAISDSRGDWIKLPREIVRGYMFFLANQVAKRRNLERCTDDKYSFSISAFFSEEANFDNCIYKEASPGYYSSLIFNDLLPFDVSQVPMNAIVKACELAKDEKIRFRSELIKFTEAMYKCNSKEHAELILKDYKNDLLSAKEALKAALGIMGRNGQFSFFAVGVPTALAVYSTALSLGTSPFSMPAIGTSLTLGAVAAYNDYSKAVSALSNPYGAAYLVSLEKHLTSANYPRFYRHFEEFLND